VCDIDRLASGTSIADVDTYTSPNIASRIDNVDDVCGIDLLEASADSVAVPSFGCDVLDAFFLKLPFQLFNLT
jgi:hypothetical protein